MNRVDRLLGYLIVFQSRELVRAQDLATRFEVSERTVYRDVEALLELGVPLVGVAGEGYRLMAGYSLPPIMFTEAETQALFLAIAMLSGLTQNGPTKAAAATALEKVQAILPTALLERAQALQKVLGFYAVGHPPVNLDDERFVQLQRAVDRNQVVYLHYHAQHSNRITARSNRSISPFLTVYGYCMAIAVCAKITATSAWIALTNSRSEVKRLPRAPSSCPTEAMKMCTCWCASMPTLYVGCAKCSILPIWGMFQKMRKARL